MTGVPTERLRRITSGEALVPLGGHEHRLGRAHQVGDLVLGDPADERHIAAAGDQGFRLGAQLAVTRDDQPDALARHVAPGLDQRVHPLDGDQTAGEDEGPSLRAPGRFLRRGRGQSSASR